MPLLHKLFLWRCESRHFFARSAVLPDWEHRGSRSREFQHYYSIGRILCRKVHPCTSFCQLRDTDSSSVPPSAWRIERQASQGRSQEIMTSLVNQIWSSWGWAPLAHLEHLVYFQRTVPIKTYSNWHRNTRQFKRTHCLS